MLASPSAGKEPSPHLRPGARLLHARVPAGRGPRGRHGPAASAALPRPPPSPAGTDPAASAAGFPALKADLNGLAGGRVVLWPVPHVPGPRPSSWSASRHPRVHPQAPRALPRRRASVQPQERRRASRRASARLSQPCSSGRPRGQGQTVSRRSDRPRRQRAGKRLVSRPRLPPAWPAVPAVVTLAGPLWPGPVASPYLGAVVSPTGGPGRGCASPARPPPAGRLTSWPRPGACGPEHSPGLLQGRGDRRGPFTGERDASAGRWRTRCSNPLPACELRSCREVPAAVPLPAPAPGRPPRTARPRPGPPGGALAEEPEGLPVSHLQSQVQTRGGARLEG